MYVGQQNELANANFKNLEYNLIDTDWMGRFHLFIYGNILMTKTVKYRIISFSFIT